MIEKLKLPTRFWDKVQYIPYSGCWLWVGGLRKGYGRFWFEGKYHTAHRLSWLADGRTLSKQKTKVLDHVVCETKACINPNHLAEVRQQQNIWRHYNG